jgi:hypothetical protein
MHRATVSGPFATPDLSVRIKGLRHLSGTANVNVVLTSIGSPGTGMSILSQLMSLSRLAA